MKGIPNFPWNCPRTAGSVLCTFISLSRRSSIPVSSTVNYRLVMHMIMLVCAQIDEMPTIPSGMRIHRASQCNGHHVHQEFISESGRKRNKLWNRFQQNLCKPSAAVSRSIIFRYRSQTQVSRLGDCECLGLLTTSLPLVPFFLSEWTILFWNLYARPWNVLRHCGSLKNGTMSDLSTWTYDKNSNH